MRHIGIINHEIMRWELTVGTAVELNEAATEFKTNSLHKLW